MGISPQFVEIPVIGTAKLSGVEAANTSLAGLGTLGVNIFQILTAGTNGTRIDDLTIHLAGTTAASSANVVRFYLADAAGSEASRVLIRQVQLTAKTPSNGVSSFFISDEIPRGRHLAFGSSLLVAANVVDAGANQLHISAYGGHY